MSASSGQAKFDGSGFRVGLVWRGNPKHENDKYRSVDLATLMPLLNVTDVAFYSLQVGAASAELRQLPSDVHVTDLAPQLTDFVETARLVSQLDLVISVDTAVAHLAGALGKPVWVLVARGNDWRWLHGRSDSPWYPTLKIFRQTPPRDWNVPVRQIARELTALALESKA